jgi:hypothetical protein
MLASDDISDEVDNLNRHVICCSEAHSNADLILCRRRRYNSHNRLRAYSDQEPRSARINNQRSIIRDNNNVVTGPYTHGCKR